MVEIDIISKMFHDTMRHKLEENGIAPGYRRVIFHLVHHDGITQSELTKMAHLSAPSISVMIEKMEREGLVEKKSDESDGRQSRISLTQAGHGLVEIINMNVKETEKIALEGLKAEETDTLKRLLDRVFNNLEKNGEIFD